MLTYFFRNKKVVDSLLDLVDEYFQKFGEMSVPDTAVVNQPLIEGPLISSNTYMTRTERYYVAVNFLLSDLDEDEILFDVFCDLIVGSLSNSIRKKLIHLIQALSLIYFAV
eukprot:GHVP01062868.1.p1 GENE.GHVP01062868.1~~GHVP01062868.1.p1  ORF type:complete len:111 (-),score=21.04 GHVP01062868.1:53-385(-)